MMNIESCSFGKTSDNKETTLFTLTNDHGLRARVLDFGACLVSLEVPDRAGKLADVVLGYETIGSYERNPYYFGVCIGRLANRTKNGRFTLEGREYQLTQNQGQNHLHGGAVGFSKKHWGSQTKEDTEGVHLILTYQSQDHEESYPGTLDCRITYTLSNENELILDYHATTDKTTVVNLTNHSYFNLAGHDQGDILSHELMIEADEYTVLDETAVPTGQIQPVEGTAFDFRHGERIGRRIQEVASGYDLNYVLNKSKPNECSPAARVSDPTTGRVMELYTTQPGVQFYTGNFLGTRPDAKSGKELAGKGGAAYLKHHALCLETQHFPDSPNHPVFPSVVLRPGQRYHEKAVHKFSAE